MLPGDLRKLFNKQKFRLGDEGREDGNKGRYYHSCDKDLVIFVPDRNFPVKQMNKLTYNNRKRGRAPAPPTIVIDLTLEEDEEREPCFFDFPPDFSVKKTKVETVENVNTMNIEAQAYCFDLFNESEAWKILEDTDRLLCF